MLKEKYYDRAAVFAYAREWAYKRNPAYYNFDGIGGDCTNFASQCIYAGCKVMNYQPIFGWYYKSLDSRTPSWTGVQYFYNFLVSNNLAGAYGKLVEREGLDIGDLIQLGNGVEEYYHSLIVVGKNKGEIFVAAHTFDTFYRPLSSYNFSLVRYIKIGAREYIQ